MNKGTIIAIIIVVAAVGVGAYWYMGHGAAAPTGALGLNGSPSQGNLGGADTGTPQQPGDGTDVSQNLILGVVADDANRTQFLTAYNGMTVYTYSPDKPDQSNCTGQCAANWPPYSVGSAADIHVPATLSAAKVGTITRADGTLQVTYNHMPLYFYIKDKQPGDTTGQGVGGVWYTVQP